MANPNLFFVYFRPFLFTFSQIQSERSIDGVLGIQTRGRERPWYFFGKGPITTPNYIKDYV